MFNPVRNSANNKKTSKKPLTTNRRLSKEWGNPREMTKIHIEILSEKKILLNFYSKIYHYITENLSEQPVNVEIGSGSSKLYEYIEGLIRTNIVFVEQNDLVFSAYEMPFLDNSVGNIILINVLHHFGDPYGFLQEAERVLKSGGRILISDPYLSLLSYPVWTYLHPEGCNSKQIGFITNGNANPLTDANSANATIMFCTDKKPFNKYFNSLSLVKLEYHTKFQYWLAGGYNFPQFIPTSFLPIVDYFERLFSPFDRWLASFLFAVIEKKERIDV